MASFFLSCGQDTATLSCHMHHVKIYIHLWRRLAFFFVFVIVVFLELDDWMICFYNKRENYKDQWRATSRWHFGRRIRKTVADFSRSLRKKSFLRAASQTGICDEHWPFCCWGDGDTSQLTPLPEPTRRTPDPKTHNTDSHTLSSLRSAHFTSAALYERKTKQRDWWNQTQRASDHRLHLSTEPLIK